MPKGMLRRPPVPFELDRTSGTSRSASGLLPGGGPQEIAPRRGPPPGRSWWERLQSPYRLGKTPYCARYLFISCNTGGVVTKLR
jgi:hypothetical protein